MRSLFAFILDVSDDVWLIFRQAGKRIGSRADKL